LQKSFEFSLMNEQKKIFKEWENKRIKLLESQVKFFKKIFFLKIFIFVDRANGN